MPALLDGADGRAVGVLLRNSCGHNRVDRSEYVSGKSVSRQLELQRLVVRRTNAAEYDRN